MSSNARSETFATSPWFTSAFRHQRILIPVDGWFEWVSHSGGKQPYWAHNRDGTVQFLAAIATPDAKSHYHRFAIITEPTRGRLTRLHHRQPLILAQSSLSDWLDPNLTDRNTLQRQQADLLDLNAVSTRVNTVTNNDPSLLAPLPTSIP